MDKGNQRAACSNARLFVNQAHAFGFQVGQFCGNVFDFDAQVMNSGSALGDEFADGRFIAGRFQQFNSAFADGQHRHAHALIFDNFDFRKRQPQPVAPKFQRLVNRTNSDSEMLNFAFHKIGVDRIYLIQSCKSRLLDLNLSENFFDDGIRIALARSNRQRQFMKFVWGKGFADNLSQQSLAQQLNNAVFGNSGAAFQ